MMGRALANVVKVRFHHVKQRLGERQSPIKSIQAATIQFLTGGHVRDVKFADDYSVLILLYIDSKYTQYLLIFI